MSLKSHAGTTPNRARKVFIPSSSKEELYNEISNVYNEVKSNIIKEREAKRACYNIIDKMEDNIDTCIGELLEISPTIALECVLNVIKVRPKGYENYIELISQLFESIDQSEEDKKELKGKLINSLPGPAMRLLYESGWATYDEVMENISPKNSYAFADLIEDFYDFAKGFNIESIKITRDWLMSCQIPGSIGYILKTDDVDSLIRYRDQNPGNKSVPIPSLEMMFFRHAFRYFNMSYKYGHLEYAAFYGSVHCFKYLILQGLKVNNRTMVMAVAGGNLEIVRICFQNNDNVDMECAYAAATFLRSNLNEWFREVLDKDIDIIGEDGEDDTVPLSALNILAHRIYPGPQPKHKIWEHSTHRINVYEINEYDLVDCLKHFKNPIGFAQKLIDFGLSESFLPLFRMQDEEYFRWALSKTKFIGDMPFAKIINSFKPEFLRSLPRNSLYKLLTHTSNLGEIENEDLLLFVVQNKNDVSEIFSCFKTEFYLRGFTRLLEKKDGISSVYFINPDFKKLSDARKFVNCVKVHKKRINICIENPVDHFVIYSLFSHVQCYSSYSWLPLYSAIAYGVIQNTPVKDALMRYDYYNILPDVILSLPHQSKNHCLLV